MTTLKKVLSVIDKLFIKMERKREIPDRITNELYLTRYYILFKDRKWFPINAVIHKFHKSDMPAFHDHPWNFFTFIIKGQYLEHTPKGTFLRKPFQFRFSRAKDLHRVELIDNQPVWTFFMMGSRKREWGFIKDGKWMVWSKYVNEMRNKYIDK